MYVMSRPTPGSVDRSSNRAVGRGRSGVLARAPTAAVWGRSPPVPSAAATAAPALRSPHSLASPASWPCAAPIEGRARVLLVQQAHQLQVLGALFHRSVV